VALHQECPEECDLTTIRLYSNAAVGNGISLREHANVQLNPGTSRDVKATMAPSRAACGYAAQPCAARIVGSAKAAAPPA